MAVIALVVLIAICEVMGWPFLRLPVQQLMHGQLQRDVRLAAPFSLHLIGGIRLNVGGLWIAAPQGFNAPDLVDASNVKLGLRYSDLLSLNKVSPIRIQSFRVDQIAIYLIRHKDGIATWQFHPEDKEPARPTPIIETLVVKNGSALVDDPLTQTDLQLTFNTQEGAADTTPTSSLKAQGKFRQNVLKAALTTDGFLPIAAQNADSPPLHSKAWLEYGGLRLGFDGTASDIFGKQDIKGKFAAKGASLAVLGRLVNTILPTTGAFMFNGAIEKRDAVWLATIASARVGESDLAGDFKYDPRPDVPLLQGELRGKRFLLADLAPAFGTRNEDGSKSKPADGRAIPNRPLDLPSLSKMDARIHVNLDYVDLGSAFAKPIAPLKADLTLDAGKLSLSSIYAKTADGGISGLISIDAHSVTQPDGSTKGIIPRWNIDLAWQDINLEKWLTASKERQENAKKAGEKNLPPAYVTGTLNGKTRLSGQGQSTADLLASLNGDVSIYIHQGTLSHLIVEALGLDIAQGLGLFIKGDESLPMQCAVMDMQVKQGVITPDVAVIDTPVTLVLIDGHIDMAKEGLALRLTAQPKNISPLTVRSPIHVSGSFVSPSVSPEKGPIAARLIGGIALSFINPLVAILPFIDPGSPQQTSCKDALAQFNRKALVKTRP